MEPTAPSSWHASARSSKSHSHWLSEVAGLPFIDEHSRLVDASPDETWRSLVRVATGAFSNGQTSTVSKLLGCEETETTGVRGAEGSTIPGFLVSRSDPPRELALTGRHRFSRYALTFRIEPEGSGRSRVTAETRAVFPGLFGAAYRTAVIGTRGHVLVTNRLLGSIASGAERAERAS